VPKGKWSASEFEQMMALKANGVTIREIARTLGRSEALIHNKLERGATTGQRLYSTREPSPRPPQHVLDERDRRLSVCLYGP
jgi:IS30 family transposase